MNGIVLTDSLGSIMDSRATMTCKEIAELVQSRHDNVKTSIERLARRGVIRLPALQETEEINNLGLPRKVSVYVFEGKRGRRDSTIVVAQLCPEFTARIVDRWHELEEQLSLSPLWAARLEVERHDAETFAAASQGSRAMHARKAAIPIIRAKRQQLKLLMEPELPLLPTTH
ncbi:hypothetical protein E8K88_16530 [Lampropedia aestuarii]|uniref:DNA-binding protein n=1 Tax=Lampropedia aestuarii TaxID=2562762 RepID=A0A4S5BG10_9BURK|nr:Rha family transcriptional regulator [Lampropedia aestuarii]THJ30969.1 hypothetical protein E8K88_16530 [Lampropedia aestuarii]